MDQKQKVTTNITCDGCGGENLQYGWFRRPNFDLCVICYASWGENPKDVPLEILQKAMISFLRSHFVWQIYDANTAELRQEAIELDRNLEKQTKSIQKR